MLHEDVISVWEAFPTAVERATESGSMNLEKLSIKPFLADGDPAWRIASLTPIAHGIDIHPCTHRGKKEHIPGADFKSRQPGSLNQVE